MLTKLEVRSAKGTLLDIPFAESDRGFFVKEIEGLDPVKATLVSSSFAQLDGAQYQSSRRETRNIILRVGIESDFVTNTVSNIRKELYEVFMPKTSIQMRFYLSDDLIVNAEGRVESCETALFTETPAMDISIICFDPDFYEEGSVLVSGVTTSTTIDTLIPYSGTIETGFVMTFNVNQAISNMTLYNKQFDGLPGILEFSYPLLSGDVLTISTIKGNKTAIVQRASVLTTILYAISPYSDWLQLSPGDNYFRAYAAGMGVAIPYTLEYLSKYGGL